MSKTSPEYGAPRKLTKAEEARRLHGSSAGQLEKNLDATKSILLKNAVERARARLLAMDKHLNEHGHILEKAYPLDMRVNYSIRVMQKEARYSALRFLDKIGFGVDTRLAFKADAAQMMEKIYTDAALADFSAFCFKMAKKAGSEILSATIEGDLWNGSILRLVTKAGNQVWNTKCIINRSCNNKLFNQWPSRRIN